MKCFKIMRFISFTVAMFVMFGLSVSANNNKYYSKVTAVAVGDGKVYVSYKTEAEEPEFASESSAESGADEQSSTPQHTYFLYAQENEGNKFVGWYDNEGCAGNALTTDKEYSVSFEVSSTNEASPSAKNFYAKFVNSSAPYLACTKGHIYINIDSEPIANDGIETEDGVMLQFSSSNTDVATVDADGKVAPVGSGSAWISVSAGFEPVSYVVTVIDNVSAGVTQIGNGDFEDWRGVSDSNHAPDNWNSFETNEGTYASLARAQQVQMVEEHRPGSNGFYCADIYSRSVVGVVAQGNLTTGCINAGAMSASGKDNYNYSKISDPNKSETISKIPSAIRLWVKFVPAAENDEHPNAHVSVTVHDAHNYITYSPGNDTEENDSYVIAHAEKDFPACDWTELTIPFEKTGNYTDGQMYILVNLSTNADPGQGQSGDHMYIDDIELLYSDPEPVIYNKYVSIGHDTPTETPIEVTFNDNKTIDFGLKNFGLNIGGNYLNVGNVIVSDLPIDEEGNFSFEGSIQISAGDKEGVYVWMGPMLGDIPVELDGTIKDDYFYAHLNINISGVSVEVEAGDLANTTFSIGDAFVGTFCAPFTTVIPEGHQSFISISTIIGAEPNGVLILDSIENGVIPANTPVVVQIPQAFELPVSGIYVKGTPTVGMLTGVYESTPAPVGSYVLQKIDGIVGFYQVAEGDQPIVNTNCAYLTAPGSKVKAFYFNEEDATGISSIDNGQLTIDNAIYDLAGQRINKLQKGINIINGKKILK